MRDGLVRLRVNGFLPAPIVDTMRRHSVRSPTRGLLKPARIAVRLIIQLQCELITRHCRSTVLFPVRLDTEYGDNCTARNNCFRRSGNTPPPILPPRRTSSAVLNYPAEFSNRTLETSSPVILCINGSSCIYFFSPRCTFDTMKTGLIIWWITRMRDNVAKLSLRCNCYNS